MISEFLALEGDCPGILCRTSNRKSKYRGWHGSWVRSESRLRSTLSVVLIIQPNKALVSYTVYSRVAFYCSKAHLLPSCIDLIQKSIKYTFR